MAGPFDSTLIPAPPDWTAGSLGSGPPDPDATEKPADPVGAWDHFWRTIGRDLPATVNRTRALTRALRQSRIR